VTVACQEELYSIQSVSQSASQPASQPACV